MAKLLILSQVFLPDPASVGQHIADVAFEMARRGHEVVVYTADRGYEDPTVRFLRRETMEGVDVRRLPFSSFGKKSIPVRILGTALFMGQAFAVTLVEPGVRGMLFSTSPPLIGFVASLAGALRNVPGAYWAMDLNPDQLLALGKIKPNSAPALFLETINRFVLRRAKLVVALDRFMADRLRPRAPGLDDKMRVMPPWPHEDHLAPVDQQTNPFRIAHDLVGKRVIMYSGNHSPSNPLTTVLEAAVRFKDDPRVVFAFVGGGLGKKEVEATIAAHGLKNAISLPYQPLADLRFSLSAGDVHVVSLGGDMVGIIHPCKVYGAMAASRPVLFFGPRPSHVSDLLDHHGFGWHVDHGDVEGAVRAIDEILRTPQEKLAAMGEAGRAALDGGLSQKQICGALCDELEGMMMQGG
ncbi:MAG: glycosyltransferase family 4 protein [Byssovorax sp.]